MGLPDGGGEAWLGLGLVGTPGAGRLDGACGGGEGLKSV